MNPFIYVCESIKKDLNIAQRLQMRCPVIVCCDGVQLIYNVFHSTDSMQLYEFTIIFGVLVMALSQIPSFHSLRYINLASLLCSLAYSLCAVGGCIYAGRSILSSIRPINYCSYVYITHRKDQRMVYIAKVCASRTGHSSKALAAKHNVVGSPVSKMFGVFNSLVIIATTYGNGIIPEIQVRSDTPYDSFCIQLQL